MNRSKTIIGNALICLGGVNFLVAAIVAYLSIWAIWPEGLDAGAIGFGHVVMGAAFVVVGAMVKI